MSQSATARAKAVQMLEEHITDLKRAERTVKQAIRSGRQAQAAVTGIDIIPTQPGGKVDHEDTDTLAQA